MRRSSFLLVCAAAAALAADLAPDRKDPQFQKTGEMTRTYLFPATGERIPYHLVVPKKWNTKTRLPLVIVLH